MCKKYVSVFLKFICESIEREFFFISLQFPSKLNCCLLMWKNWFDFSNNFIMKNRWNLREIDKCWQKKNLFKYNRRKRNEENFFVIHLDDIQTCYSEIQHFKIGANTCRSTKDSRLYKHRQTDRQTDRHSLSLPLSPPPSLSFSLPPKKESNPPPKTQL